MKKLMIIIFFSLLSSTNGFNQTQYMTVEINGLFSLSIPDYLKKTTQLNNTAPVQFQNLNKKLLVIVDYEEKQKFDKLFQKFTVDDYYNYVVQQITQKLEAPLIDKPSKVLNNSLLILQGNVNGNFLGTPLRYIVEVVESETHYFQVICWTEEKTLNEVGDDINQIINSLKEMK